MTYHISKLMAFFVMSFYILSPNVFAKETEKEVTKEVTEEVVRSVQREINKHAIGVGLGQTFLYGQYEDYGDNKIVADFFYSYSASYSFDLLVNIHSSKHSYKDKEVNLLGTSMGIKARFYEFDAFSPFLLGGLGFYAPQIKNGDLRSEIKNTFGFNTGAGIDLRLNQKITVGLLYQFHKPFEVKQEDMVDLTGYYAKLLITVMYQF